MSTSSPRLPLIDSLKALASQLIVLHHLAFYGPMSDVAYDLAPALLDWLSGQARIAVQAFLVIGGFLAARRLAPAGEPMLERPLALIGRRYRRLIVPYLAAIALAVGAAATARAWMQLDSIPAAPSVAQLIAHALLLQDVLGYEALSAGLWYVAIDFQLYALLSAVLWLARRSGPATGGFRRVAPALAPALVSALAIASLFHFNRDADWDHWAPYFFGSYALGALAFWASDRARRPIWLAAIAAVAVVALLVDFRIRIAVALAVALALGIARKTTLLERWPGTRPSAFLGRIAYSVFLVHYPVCLVVNAAFARFAPGDPVANAIGLVVAWGASLLAGAVFFRYVENRLGARRTLPAGSSVSAG